MEAIGLMPSSTGQPGGARTGERVADYAIEGSAFVRACGTLLTQSFCLTWYDRFAAPARVMGVGAVAARMDSAVGGGDPPYLAMPALSEVMIATGAAGGASTASGQVPPTGAVRQAGGSNRWKYTCPCRTSVWGKPHLKLICGACNERFVSTDADPVGAAA
jgi:hypothetical protein